MSLHNRLVLPRHITDNCNTQIFSILKGGVHKAVTNAAAIGCKAFALFLKSQRQWNAKPLDPDVIQQFTHLCQVCSASLSLIPAEWRVDIDCLAYDS